MRVLQSSAPVCSRFIGGSQQQQAEIGDAAFTNYTTKLWSTQLKENRVFLCNVQTLSGAAAGSWDLFTWSILAPCGTKLGEQLLKSKNAEHMRERKNAEQATVLGQ